MLVILRLQMLSMVIIFVKVIPEVKVFERFGPGLCMLVAELAMMCSSRLCKVTLLLRSLQILLSIMSVRKATGIRWCIAICRKGVWYQLLLLLLTLYALGGRQWLNRMPQSTVLALVHVVRLMLSSVLHRRSCMTLLLKHQCLGQSMKRVALLTVLAVMKALLRGSMVQKLNWNLAVLLLMMRLTVQLKTLYTVLPLVKTLCLGLAIVMRKLLSLVVGQRLTLIAKLPMMLGWLSMRILYQGVTLAILPPVMAMDQSMRHLLHRHVINNEHRMTLLAMLPQVTAMCRTMASFLSMVDSLGY